MKKLICGYELFMAILKKVCAMELISLMKANYRFKSVPPTLVIPSKLCRFTLSTLQIIILCHCLIYKRIFDNSVSCRGLWHYNYECAFVSICSAKKKTNNPILFDTFIRNTPSVSYHKQKKQFSLTIGY